MTARPQCGAQSGVPEVAEAGAALPGQLLQPAVQDQEHWPPCDFWPSTAGLRRCLQCTPMQTHSTKAQHALALPETSSHQQPPTRSTCLHTFCRTRVRAAAAVRGAAAGAPAGSSTASSGGALVSGGSAARCAFARRRCTRGAGAAVSGAADIVPSLHEGCRVKRRTLHCISSRSRSDTDCAQLVACDRCKGLNLTLRVCLCHR